MPEPIKLADIELRRPLRPIPVPGRYAWVQALVRLDARPLGWVTLPITAGECSIGVQNDCIVTQLGEAIQQRLVELGLEGAVPAEGLSLADLLLVHSPKQSRQLPSVTVAVCTRDRPDDLARCLEAISQLDYPEFEVVVVDNAPRTDGVKRLISERYPTVRYVLEPRAGLDWARNQAILTSRGEIIAFTDDDVVVDPGWLQAITREFEEDPAVMAVTGLVVPFELEASSQIYFEWYGGFSKGFRRRWFRYRTDDAGRRILIHGAGQFGTGANMAFRRSVFDRIGFFDPALDVGTPTNGGGDLDLYFRVLKAGYALVYDPDAVVRHRHRADDRSLNYQIEGWGSGFWAFAIRAGEAFPEERPGFREVARWWVRHWVLARLWRGFRRSERWILGPLKAEVLGALKARSAYRAARRRAATIAQEFGDPTATLVRSGEQGLDHHPGITGVRTIDLAEPVSALDGVGDCDRVRVYVALHGRPIGDLTVPSHGQPIPAAKLRQLIAAACGHQLLEPDHDLGSSVRWARTYGSLSRFLSRPDGSSPPLSQSDSAGHAVSVIVGTFDRPADLRRCLASLQRQSSARPIEIVVVDNHPASGLTPPVVAEFPGVVLVSESRAGVSYARNAGFVASHGDLILTTDDDVVVSPDWVERLVAPFSNANVALVTGNILPIELETESQRLFEDYGGLGRGFKRVDYGSTWFHWFTRRAAPTWDLGGTANTALRASLLGDRRIGLLDERLGPGTPTGVGEDTYLFYRTLAAGHHIVYEPAAYVWHRHRRDLPSLRRQIYNYSKGHVAYHLVTLFDDGDRRALWQIFYRLPGWHLRRLRRWLRGNRDYPLSLLFAEITGNLAGPWCLWRSVRRVKRLGRSAPYLAPEARDPEGSPAPDAGFDHASPGARPGATET